MGKRAKKEASLSYASLILALIGSSLCCFSIVIPKWTSFSYQPKYGWGARNFGLFMVSTQWTDTMTTSADLTWLRLRDSACATAVAQNGLMSTNLAAGAAMATSALASAVGATCRSVCKVHIMDRCLKYKAALIGNILIAGIVAGGSILSLIGAVMPLLGKERDADKRSNLIMECVGAFLAIVGMGLYFAMMHMWMFPSFSASSVYPPGSIGIAFYMCAGGAVFLILTILPQFSKLSLKKKDKKVDEDLGGSSIGGGATKSLDPLLL